MVSSGGAGALSGLSALVPGYQQGEETQAKIDKEKRDALATKAAGSALQMLAQSGMGQQNAMQVFGPGGGPQPAPPPGGGMPPQGAPPGAGPMPQPPPPGQQSQPMQRPGMPPQGGPPMGAPPQGGMPPGAPPRPPMGGAPPGMPPGPQAGPPGGQPPPQLPGGRQPLDWRQIVQAVQQSNPNIPPDVLMQAVNQFLPMMTQQSQSEWRQVSLQMREQALQQREQQFMLAEQGKGQRAAGVQEGKDKDRVSKETIAKMTVDERREAMEAGLITRQEIADAQIASREKEGAANRGSRESIAGANRDQRQQQFETRENRLQESLKLREDSTWARLEQQKQAAIQRAQAAGGKQGLAEARAVIDAQDKHIRTRIQAYSQNNTMKPAERKAMLDEADAQYREEIAKLKQVGAGAPAGPAAPPAQGPTPAPAPTPPAGGVTPPPAPAGGAAPVKVTTPEEAEKLPPGTHYVTPDGKEYVR